MSSYATSEPKWVTSTKPLYHHYLYLDAAEILNALAGLEGGEETERVRTTVKELGGNLDAKFALAGVDVSLGGKGRKQLQEELKLKQTIHSAAGSLISKLTKGNAVAEIRSPDLDKVWETLFVKFDADLVPLRPEHEPLPEKWWDRVRRGDPADRAAESRAYELGGWTLVAYADLKAAERPTRRVALELQTTYLTPDYRDEFCRRATILGQVVYVASESERLGTRSLTDRTGVRLWIEDSADRQQGEPPAAPAAHVDKEVARRGDGTKQGFLRRLFGRRKQTTDAEKQSAIGSVDDGPDGPDGTVGEAGFALSPAREGNTPSEQAGSAAASGDSPAEQRTSTPSVAEAAAVLEPGDGESGRKGSDEKSESPPEMVVRVGVKPLCIYK